MLLLPQLSIMRAMFFLQTHVVTQAFILLSLAATFIPDAREKPVLSHE